MHKVNPRSRSADSLILGTFSANLMAPTTVSQGSIYRKSISNHQDSLSSVYSRADPLSADDTIQPAKAAAAVAFIRARERSGHGLGHRVKRSASSSLGGQSLYGQNSSIGSTKNTLRRRQSVRFVNQTTEEKRATSSISAQILAEKESVSLLLDLQVQPHAHHRYIVLLVLYPRSGKVL